MSRRALLSLLCLAALSVSGCAGAPATLDAAQVAAVAGSTLQALGTAAAIAETQTATQLWTTPTHTPTITPSPTATATDTATPTATATPLPSGTVLAAGRLRAGPGVAYDAGAQLAGGESATALGQTADGGWLLIALADGTQGWLPAENFVLTAGSADLPIITDLPPTPTQPPATATPAATATPTATTTKTPSPYTCDFTISNDVRDGYIVFQGSGWPPSTDVTLAFNGVTYSTGQVRTGDANSTYPYGFHYSMQGGPGNYTLSTPECSRTVTYGG